MLNDPDNAHPYYHGDHDHDHDDVDADALDDADYLDHDHHRVPREGRGDVDDDLYDQIENNVMESAVIVALTGVLAWLVWYRNNRARTGNNGDGQQGGEITGSANVQQVAVAQAQAQAQAQAEAQARAQALAAEVQASVRAAAAASASVAGQQQQQQQAQVQQQLQQQAQATGAETGMQQTHWRPPAPRVEDGDEEGDVH